MERGYTYKTTPTYHRRMLRCVADFIQVKDRTTHYLIAVSSFRALQSIFSYNFIREKIAS